MWQLELRESLLCSWSMGFQSFGIRGAISCGNFPKNTGIVHVVSSDFQTTVIIISIWPGSQALSMKCFLVEVVQ